MTANKLINLLMQYDPNTEVYIQDNYTGETTSAKGVSKISFKNEDNFETIIVIN